MVGVVEADANEVERAGNRRADAPVSFENRQMCIRDSDVSERAYQTERSGTWDKGKGCDTFGPVGPYLVTKDEVPDPQNLKLWTEVDGVRMQDSSTSNMIYGVKFLVSYVSQFITLHPGDIIATGTPAGVGLGKKPEPIFLRPGQQMKAGVQGLGEQVYKTVGG